MDENPYNQRQPRSPSASSPTATTPTGKKFFNKSFSQGNVSPTFLAPPASGGGAGFSYETEYARYLDAYESYAASSNSQGMLPPYQRDQRPSDASVMAELEKSGCSEDDGQTEYMYNDKFFDSPAPDLTTGATATGVATGRNETTLSEENSPIEIVAATVSTYDDPTLPCLTFRFWLMATFFTILGAVVSQIYYFRPNILIFSVFFVQLVTYPLGRLMEKALPRRDFNFFGMKFSLNPGPFNVKEHLLIGISTTAGGSIAYAIDILATTALFYNRPLHPVPSILLLITSQCLGYGIAGLLRSILVDPASMIWPSNLVQVALYNTLHGRGEPNAPGMKRFRFFLIMFVAAFVYQLLPAYFMPIITSLSIVCWIFPNNGVAQLFGSGMQGFGMGCFSLDWNVVASFGPLYSPWWAQVNYLFGAAVMVWLVAPLLYWFNLWDAWSMDLISASQYDTEGQIYDVQRILTEDREKTPLLDEAKLEAYSPLRISPYFAFNYGVNFLMITATIMHVFLYYRHAIINHFRQSMLRNDDIHTKLMRNYPQVPQAWYIILFLTMLMTATLICDRYLDLQWWGLLLAVTISAILTLPIGIIQAISNNQVGLNVLTELIFGYINPGHPLSNATFKTYGYMTMSQCLMLVADMKLGHYMKIPPRKLFVVQLYGTIVGALANYVTMQFILDRRMEALRGSDQLLHEEPRNAKVFYSASIIWGAIGPARMFGSDSPYSPLYWGFLLGALLPIPFYLLHRRFPKQKWEFVNIPIIALGASSLPSNPANFILSVLIVSFFFQFYLYRYQHSWWRRYNYILSAALDSGTQFCVILVYLLLTSSDVKPPEWWGNPPGTSDGCNISLAVGGPYQKVPLHSEL